MKIFGFFGLLELNKKPVSLHSGKIYRKFIEVNLFLIYRGLHKHALPVSIAENFHRVPRV